MTLPLAGIKVLDLTRLLPGGYATLLLADLGADVVKIEEPGKGDYIRWTPPMMGQLSAGHVALNRNKRSLTLNLKSAAGRDVFLMMAATSDVVVESFRPGVMARLGVGWEALRERNDRLVYCAITGYGQDGPRAQEAGHDANYIGLSGALSITGPEGGPPSLPGVQIGDLGGGGMAAVIAILAAVRQREVTGRGDFCDISMLDGIVSWLGLHAAGFFATGDIPERGRMPLSGAYPCYRVYPAADGYLTVAALEPQFWHELCLVLDRLDLHHDAFAMGERRNAVVAELEAIFQSRTRKRWMQLFEGRDVCVAPVNDLDEALEDEQIRGRSMVVVEEVPSVGPIRHIGNPIKLGSSTGGNVVRRPPPDLGEHTQEVLAEFGIDRAGHERLKDAGAI
ncbi:MAG: CoA transferase [Actinomycetota bacterium]|nr:CoA transferase [Actinomycetota bacterium]